MRTSKYLNKKFDNNWVCTHVGVARTQPKFYKGTRKTSRRPGHQSYYYIFERVTSDHKAEKLIRLNAGQAAKVFRNEIQVESLAKKRASRHEKKFISKISYHFYN